MLETEVKNMKSNLYQILKNIKANNRQTDQGLISRGWDASNQPWLTPKPVTSRPTTPAALSGMRADSNGLRRDLVASDLGIVLDCEKSFSASYAGEVLVKLVNKSLVGNGSKAGSIWHTYMEAILPDWIMTELSEKKRKQSGSKGRNRTFVQLPSIGQMTLKENKSKTNWFDGITGKIDAYMIPFNTGLELKSVPPLQDFPTEVPSKALGQAASYMYAMRKNNKDGLFPTHWVWLYLPSDLTKFDPEDISTYRVFIKTWAEVETTVNIILKRAAWVASLVDQCGFEGAQQYLTCFKGEDCTTCSYTRNLN
jgi:hypothetical protein